MRKILLVLFLQGSASLAVDAIEFPPSLNEKVLQKVKAYLSEPSAWQSVLLTQEIEKLQPKGLVYVDSILKLITADERPWQAYHEKRAWLLDHLSSVVRVSDQWISFDRSSLKKSIHDNAQKILKQFRNPTQLQSHVVSLYNALNLWDETDLPFVIQIYFRDRSYAPLLVRLFVHGDDETKKRFAKRVRRNNRYEFVETALLYQSLLLRDDEMIFLFYRLLDDAYFGKLSGNPMLEFYEDEVRLMEQFKLKLVLHLHERLRENDPLVLSIYNELRENPQVDRPNPTESQKEAYREFLQRLWTGHFSEDCLVRLIQ
jgi:hypothetical protein